MSKLLSKFIIMIAALGLVLGLNACSNNANNTKNKPKTIQTLNKQQKVELGTVVAVRTIQIKPSENNTYVSPYGNIGVSASSGGFRGIHGSIDLATLGRLFKNNSETKTAQEIIVKKNSGETVAITQELKENFKQGDSVKILIRNGNAQVIH